MLILFITKLSILIIVRLNNNIVYKIYSINLYILNCYLLRIDHFQSRRIFHKNMFRDVIILEIDTIVILYIVNIVKIIFFINKVVLVNFVFH